MSISQAEPREDRAVLAVIAMVLTNLTLSGADATIKVTVSDMPLSQFIFLRTCITLPALIAILKWRFPAVSLRPVRPGWAIARSALLLASLLLYYASLPRLDFSLAAASYYTIPLFVTLFSAFWTRDTIGAKGWFGVTLGFCAVLLMLKPDARDLNVDILLPLGAAILYALAMVLTRTRSRAENPFVLAFVFNAIAICLGGAIGVAGFFHTAESGTSVATVLVGDWQPARDIPWLLIVLLSLTMLIGSVGTATAYQLGPASLVSTWDFSYLAFAVLLGVTVFSESLDLISLLGIALIPLAGVIVLRR